MTHQGRPTWRGDPFRSFANQDPLHFPVQHHSAGGVVLAQKTNRCGFLRSLGLGGPKHGALRNRRTNQTKTGGIKF